jgi:hypothetical protein
MEPKLVTIHYASYFLWNEVLCVCVFLLFLQIINYEEVTDPPYKLSQMPLRLNKPIYECQIALFKKKLELISE